MFFTTFILVEIKIEDLNAENLKINDTIGLVKCLG